MNSNLLFFKLCKNNKIPIKNEKFTDVKTSKPLNKINTNFYNVGISCKVNNLIILDIDVKDDGILEWANYIKEHNEPLTVKAKTPSGGFHFYFNSSSLNYTNEEIELINNLKNKSKYRNKGLDIRKNNGYVACEPSIINSSKYEFIRHYKDNKILDIPLTLLKWLLEFEKLEKHTNEKLIIMDDIKQLINLLEMFENTNTKQWVKITACIKQLLHPYNNFNDEELKTTWDNWSLNSNKYNKVENYKIWDTIDININFNYMIFIYNKANETKLKQCESIKHYKPLINNITNIKQLQMSNNYIYDENYKGDQLTDDIFYNNNTIIIESTTGTGKTSNTAKFISKYIKSEIKATGKHYKVLSIVSRKTLASQHIESFKKEKIVMTSYKDEQKDIDDNNLVVCINSILLYSKYKPSFFKNYIVYIDEISTFTRHLTNNKTLDSKLKLVYITLMKIINNCDKLILTEALINDNVFNIVDKRPNETKIYIRNSFKKYKGVEAIQYNNENNFLELLISKVIKQEPFLFGCDSNNKITSFYNECLKYDDKLKFILITSDTKFNLEDVNEQFLNKYVFYSPSITCGVDFNIDTLQDVFLYMKGDTLEPCDSFQQVTRTRNIKKFIFI